MAEISKTRRLFTTRVVGIDEIGGARCTIGGRKTAFSGCSYDVLLEKGSEEPILAASGTFVEALAALQRDDNTKTCGALLKAVSLTLGDPAAGIAMRFKEGELSALALLVAGDMTIDRMAAVLKSPESSVEIALLSLRSDGLVWRKQGPQRPYALSETGRRVCELMREEERFVEAAKRILAQEQR